MKLINKIFILGLFSLLFIGCEDTNPIQPGESPQIEEGCMGVYFPTTNTKVFELEPTEATVIEITIARTLIDSLEAQEVTLVVVENTDDVFEIPETITFAPEAESVTFEVNFPNAEEGKAYKLSLAVEGEKVVNKYSSLLPNVSTSVTRISWTTLEDPVIYVDGTIITFFGVELLPMYAWGERAETSDVIKYRFKNVYKYTAEKDEDGIYGGYPYNVSKYPFADGEYTTIIEINKKTEAATMEPHDIGLDWGYGMMSIGTILGNLSTNATAYPLGVISGDKITFPPSSLYIADDEGASVANKAPTLIYLTKEAYIADNLKIDDFNDVEYEYIEGAVTEFYSAAFDEGWNQTIAVAIDLDEENEESDYKDLYYLEDLYAEDYGLAFYNFDGKIKIPAEQKIGLKIFGQEVYVSQSDSISSSFSVTAGGVDAYVFGLKFHYKDGTVLGHFVEEFFYSENAITVEKADFHGSFVLTGESPFEGEEPLEETVKISAGEGVNTFVITGVPLAEEILAKYNETTSVMTIAPQELADYGPYDISLFTLTAAGQPSGTATISFKQNIKGNLVLASDTKAIGYLLNSDEAGGFVDGAYDLVFTRVKEASKVAPLQKAAAKATLKTKTQVKIQKVEKSTKNFKVQAKSSTAKTVKKVAQRI